jgi:hypothetical protein
MFRTGSSSTTGPNLRFRGKSMKTRWVLFVLALAVFVCSAPASKAQCDGLKFAGYAYGEGHFNSNLYGYGEVLLPPNTKLDKTFHQTTISAVANGKSDARSRLVPSDVPAGICIVPTGDNSANHGWAIGDGIEPRIKLEPANWDDNNVITQFKFGIRLYCTTGSGIGDMTTGGCNAKVAVYYKPLTTTAKNVSTKNGLPVQKPKS